MSGICGWASGGKPAGDGRALLDEMLTTLRHRGPDGRKTWFGSDANVALGQVQLDAFLPAGAVGEPALAGSGRAAAIVDGPVFTTGAFPPAANPARTVLQAHDLRGADFAQELEGPHVIALWDGRRLFLLRDALGEKPLYFHHSAATDTLVFGSEIKALLQHPAVERAVDHEGLGLYLTFGWIPAPKTLFRGIEKLAPGELLEWEPGREPTRRRHWTLPPLDLAEGDRASLAARCEETLVRAVEKRVRGMDEVGVLLSGGMDSTILIIILRELGIRRIDTFTLGLPSDHLQERDVDVPYARLVAERFGTRHHELDLTGGLDPTELMPALTEQYDDPILSPNTATKYLLADLARRSGSKSVLTGSAAGGACGPYRRFRDPPLRRKMMKKIRGLETDAARFLRLRGKVLGLRDQRDLLREAPLTRERLEGFIAPVVESVHLDEYPRSYVLANLLLTIPEKASAILDRSGMLASVDLASPYLDREVVELQMRLPSTFDGGESFVGIKCLLEDAFRGRIPAEILTRPETGFPSYFWHEGELDPLRARLLAREGSSEAGLFRAGAVRRILDEEARDTTSKSVGKLAWAFVQLDLWHALHILGQPGQGRGGLERVSGAILQDAVRLGDPKASRFWTADVHSMDGAS